MFESVCMRIMLCICLLCLSSFLVSMTVYVVAITGRAIGLPADRRKAAEEAEKKERQEKAERERSKVGKII